MMDLTHRGLHRQGPGAAVTWTVLVLLVVAGLASPASADYKGGERALGMLDYARALEEFRSAAADGDLRALFEIGLIYERGHGVTADPARAARWYRKAVQEATGPAPRALARKALARVGGKEAPSVASLPVTRPVEAPAPIALARIAAKDDPPPSASPPPAVRRALFRAGLYGESLPFFATALAPVEGASGQGRPAAGDLSFDLANVAVKDEPAAAEARLWAVSRGRDLFREGRYAEATPFIEKALELSDHQLGPDHAETGALLHDLAKLMGIQGRNAEAEPLYKRSVDVLDNSLGADHPLVAGSLDGLAGLYLVQGRMAEAEPLFVRSLAIRENALGAAHPLVAASLNNLAELYRGQARYADAEPLHKRSLAISEKALGAAHPSVGLILSNLTELYRAQGRDAEAVPLIERSLEILLNSGKKPAKPSAPASRPGLL